MKKLLLVIILSQLAGCQHKPDRKAVALLKEANEIGRKSFYKNAIENGKALKLIDQAITIDDQYFSAYYAKSLVLFAKKDVDAALSNNLKMIALRPDQPLWVIQRGFLFEVKGDAIKAKQTYDSGIAKYKALLTQEDLRKDFNFRIEYVSALQKNNSKEAKTEMEKLRNDFPGNEIVESFAAYTPESKTEVINSWKNGQ